MEQPEVVAPQIPESPEHGSEIAEPQPRVDHDRMFKIANRGLWAGLLATAMTCLGYVQFLSRSPDSGSTTVASNSSQALSSALPAGDSAPTLEHQVEFRPKSPDAVEKRPQRRHRTIRAVESSPAVTVHDMPLPNLATSASTSAENESGASAPQPAEQPVEELAAASSIVTPADCDEVTPQPAPSPEAPSNKIIDYRSLSDAAVRFGKRTSGFFSRLGATVKTSF